MKSFQIGFNGTDETEFDIETKDRAIELVIFEAMWLFFEFCKENNIVVKSIDYVREVVCVGEVC